LALDGTAEAVPFPKPLNASAPCKTSGFSYMANRPLGFQQE
jgi:hypothetical protein